MQNRTIAAVAMATAFAGGFVARGVVPGEPVAYAQSTRTFELLTYTAPEGKLEALHNRFRDHTLALFKKHGMENIVYFRPVNAPASQNQLLYIVAHPSVEASRKNWAELDADPEWKQLQVDTQKDGPLIAKRETMLLQPTEYSPMK